MELRELDDLLARARSGDRAAMDAIIRQYGGLVYGVAMRQTGDAQMAADIAQAVFIVFVRRVSTIRHARWLPGWFLQTTRYAVRDARRSASRRTHYEQQAAGERTERTMDEPNPVSSDDPKAALLDNAIASLRKSDRDLVLMRFLQGREVGEIAATLGVAEDAARKRIARAIERMREYFSARGVTASADGVTAALLAAGAAKAPSAVIEACTSAIATGAVSNAAAAGVAKSVLQSIAAMKLKLVVGGTAAALVLGVGAMAVASGFFGPRTRQGILAPTPPPQLTPAVPEAKNALEQAYALPAGQDMRIFRPPYPAARAVWADAEFPYAKGSNNIRSLGFRQKPDGRFDWRYMSYADLELRQMVGDVPWYRIEGLEKVSFPPVRADFIVRDGLDYEQTLVAAGKLVEETTGVRLRITKATVTRPCIILKGQTRKPPENRSNFPTIVLTSAPWSEKLQKTWLRGGYPKGSTHQFQFRPATKLLGAPFFRDEEPQKDMAELQEVGYVGIPVEGQLKTNDPDYEIKLRRVLDNLQIQIGGDWRIERLTLDVFRIETELPPTTHPAK